jgi:hypothetical protein
MKHHWYLKSLFNKLLTLVGFLVFLFTLGVKNSLVIFTCILMTLTIFLKVKYKKPYLELLFPLSSGLLLLVMKLFYWDQADFLQRANLLLLISLVFSLVLTIRKYRLFKKFLFFFNRLSLKKRLTGIFVFTEILFIIASFILTEKGVMLGGDEPHYLVISHSIAKDFDLNVFNQYARDQYRDFIDVHLQHHARVGKGFKVWYSYGHLPGLSLTLAPFFLFKIPHPLLYFLVRAYLGIFGALLAVLVYLFSLKLWRNNSLAIFITAVFTLTVPVFFYSIHIFAELQAALLVLSSLYLLLFSVTSVSSVANNKKILLAGFLMGISVFWGLKYTIFIYLFSAGFFIYFVLKKGVGDPNPFTVSRMPFFRSFISKVWRKNKVSEGIRKKQAKRAILFVLFPLLFQILFFGYLYYAYGNFNPMSIYNGVMTEEQIKEYRSNMEEIPLQKRVETLLGIFFDQRDGLLMYNPFYFFMFPGLIFALKKYRKYWPHLLVSCAGFAFILFLGYSTVRPGYCPQARYLTPVAWLLMLFTIIYYRESQNKFFKRILLYLPIYSIFVVIYQVFYPFTLYQSVTHINLNRPGLMFQQWSNIYFSLADILPSFAKVPGNFKYLPNIIFLVLVVILTILALENKMQQAPNKKFLGVQNPFFKKGFGRRRQKVALNLGIIFVLIFFIAVLFPRVPVYNPILLAKEGTVPCKIYSVSDYPTSAVERKFELTGKKRYSFTVSTFEPAPYFVLEFENQGEKGYEMVISDFDTRVETVKLSPGVPQRVSIKNPRYKRFKGNCFYRFHLKIEPFPSGEPALYFQLYPVLKVN